MAMDKNEYYSTFQNKEFIVGGEAEKGMIPERYNKGLASLSANALPKPFSIKHIIVGI